MEIEEIYKDVENIKTNIWNNNRTLLRKEYLTYSTKNFISLLDMLTRDVNKILNKLEYETILEIEVRKRQKENAKVIKNLFK